MVATRSTRGVTLLGELPSTPRKGTPRKGTPAKGTPKTTGRKKAKSPASKLKLEDKTDSPFEIIDTPISKSNSKATKSSTKSKKKSKVKDSNSVTKKVIDSENEREDSSVIKRIDFYNEEIDLVNEITSAVVDDDDVDGISKKSKKSPKKTNLKNIKDGLVEEIVPSTGSSDTKKENSELVETEVFDLQFVIDKKPSASEKEETPSFVRYGAIIRTESDSEEESEEQCEDEDDSSSSSSSEEEDILNTDWKNSLFDNKPLISEPVKKTKKLKGEKQVAVKQKFSKDIELSSSLEPGVEIKTYVDVNPGSKQQDDKEGQKSLANSDLVDLMKKSVITSDFEKKDVIPPYQESMRQLKKQRKLEREKTIGKMWYNLPAQELTEEKKNDLMVLKMRRSLNPKRFYKGDDIRGLPKYYQMGTIVEPAADFYHSRVPKKQRKTNMVDELMADADFRKYNKRKYAEIQEEVISKRGKGAYKHMKRLKKQKK